MGNLPRPHVWPRCPSLGEQKSQQMHNHKYSLVNIHPYQVGERRVLFIYAFLAIAYVASIPFIHPFSN